MLEIPPKTGLAQSPLRPADKIFAFTLVLAFVGLMASLYAIFFLAPTEASMGIVQKIFYFHVPAAYAMYLGATACLVASAWYLARPGVRADAIAHAGAEVAVMMGAIVLVTGPLWAAKAWGVYWTWDPRLTTSMLSVLVYAAYVLLRSFAGTGESERRFAAALGVLGFANLPIIHFSVQKWGGNHPRVITRGGGGLQHPDMRTALMVGFAFFTLLAVTLLWQRARLHAQRHALSAMQERLIDAEIDVERLEGAPQS